MQRADRAGMSRKHKKRKNQDSEADFVRALDHIAHDPGARRELLWIRALERGDAATAESIERVDPGVADRLEPLALRVLECALPNTDMNNPGVLRELYLRVHDERFRHHCARFTRETCGCIECTGVPPAEQSAEDRAASAWLN